MSLFVRGPQGSLSIQLSPGWRIGGVAKCCMFSQARWSSTLLLSKVMIVINMWILRLQVSTSCLLCTHLTINRAGFCWTSRFSNSQSCKYCKNNGKFTSVFFCRNDNWKYSEIENTLKFVHEILNLVALLLDSIIASDKAMNCFHANP